MREGYEGGKCPVEVSGMACICQNGKPRAISFLEGWQRFVSPSELEWSSIRVVIPTTSPVNVPVCSVEHTDRSWVIINNALSYTMDYHQLYQAVSFQLLFQTWFLYWRKDILWHLVCSWSGKYFFSVYLLERSPEAASFQLPGSATHLHSRSSGRLSTTQVI